MASGPRASARMDFSGRERDRFFASVGGEKFVDLSYLSGADGAEDGRAFARADFDHDGHEDLVVINRNAPRLRLFRNAVGPRLQNRFLGLRLQGKLNREAVGATVTVRCDGKTFFRAVELGAGFATQNSGWLTIGVGSCLKAEAVEVGFPGAERRAFKDVATNRHYEIVEGKGLKDFVPALTVAARDNVPPGSAMLATLGPLAKKAVLVETFASWCEACQRSQPRLEALGSQFSEQLEVVGVTLEPKDDAAVIQAYRAAHAIGHRLLSFSAAGATAVDGIFGPSAPLPSIVLLEVATGRELLRTAGVPTRSEVAKALMGQK